MPPTTKATLVLLRWEVSIEEVGRAEEAKRAEEVSSARGSGYGGGGEEGDPSMFWGLPRLSQNVLQGPPSLYDTGRCEVHSESPCPVLKWRWT